MVDVVSPNLAVKTRPNEISPPAESLLKAPAPTPLNANLGIVLRGVVIVAVLVNHYFDHFTSVDRSNIANTMVSVFFVLSGYGIAASLQKRMGSGLSAGKLFTFYKTRIARIFPLLWISLLIQALVMGEPYPLSAFLGYGLVGHYWFISSILECYLLCPFLALLLNRQKHVALAGMTAVLLLSNYFIGINPALKSWLMTFHLTSFPYLEIYLINVYLFFCGMYFQRIWQARTRRIQLPYTRPITSAYPLFWVLLATALAYTVISRFVLTALPFFGSVFLFLVTALYALSRQALPQFWGSKALLFAGRHSLSLYLLHIPFYFLFARVGLIRMDSALSLLLCLALLPLFVFIALKLENLAKLASDGLLKV